MKSSRQKTSKGNPIQVRTISSQQHLEYIDSLADSAEVSFLQTPAWAKVKPEWTSESLGWFEGSELVGAGLVLYRQVPGLKRYLAYLPEGPILDWARPDIGKFLESLKNYAKSKGAFAVRIGPTLVHRTWNADTVKAAIADESIATLSEATPDFVNLDAVRLSNELYRGGWREPQDDGTEFAAGQPQYNFQLPLAGKTEDDVLKGMNQLWRRNIRRAAKHDVEVVQGTRDELADFHQIYLETAERDGFTGRNLDYFTNMWDALNAEDPKRMRLYLAKYQGELIAATTMVLVNKHSWYSYGASTTAHRNVRGSNAVQWQMIKDSLADGATVYDMRGITQGLAADDPELGLIQFKVGTGGEAVAYLGEWDLPISRPLYSLFNLVMNRRR